MTFQNARLKRKATISAAIQDAFDELGISFFDRRNKLQHCGLGTFDITENPEYLKKIIRDSYGDRYEQIIKTIQKNLSEDMNNILIESFVESLNKRS